MNLRSKLKELKPHNLNCNVFDVYNYNGLSMQELLSQFFTKINECVDLSNESMEISEWLVNEGLEEEVVEKLLLLCSDGTIEELINGNLFENLSNKVNYVDSQLNYKANNHDVMNELKLKRDKEVKIELEDLSNNVLSSITGNSNFEITSIPQNLSVNKDKLSSDLLTELDNGIENDLMGVFKIYNKNYSHSTDGIRYYLRFNAIKSLKLIGFNPNGKYRLRLIARNHNQFNYRFIICQESVDGLYWHDVFDTSSDFIVNENSKGLTYVSKTIGNKTVEMFIDYSQIPTNSSNSDGSLSAESGRYIINDKCIYENTEEYKINEINNSLANIENTLNTLNTDEVQFIKNGSSYKASFPYGEDKLTIELNELGINKIIHPKKIYKNDNVWFTVNTDWVSPYANLKAKNSQSDFIGTVGGNHGTNGSGGFPTAKSIDTKVYINNKPIEKDNITYNCNKVDIVTINHICAGNRIDGVTGNCSYSVEEVVTYSITKNNIEISVYLKALEDVSFGGYVGLQMTTDMMNGQIYFNDGNVYEPNGIKHSSPTVSQKYNGDRAIYFDNDDMIITYVDTNIGLGKREYLGSSSCWYVSEFNKIYGHLVNTPIEVKKGDSIYYKGGYSFIPTNDFYVIKSNGKNIYCCDFLNTTPKKYLNINNYSSEVDVIDKTDSINVDELVSGCGLGVSSNSWGTLKFKVKSE